MKINFFNNRKTTLTATVNIGDTTLPVASLTSDPIATQVMDGNMYVLTFTNTTETAREIVYVTSSAGGATPTSYTILKAQEGTSDLSWPSGSKVEIRISKGTLDKFTQSFYDTFTSLAAGNILTLQNSIFAAVRTGAARANSTFVAAGSIRISAAGNIAIYYLQDGTTAASEPGWGGFGNPFIATADGSAIGIGISISSADGTLDSSSGIGVTLGKGALSAGGFSTALGTDGTVTLSQGASTLSVAGGMALNDNSVAIGEGSIAAGKYSSALGGVGNIRGALFTNKIASKETRIRAYAVDSTFRRYDTNLESVVWSEPIGFNGGQTWTASTPVKNGYVYKPTAGGTNQFVRRDSSKYTDYSGMFPATYTPTNTGASQPTWPTTENFTVNDGGVQWVCHPNVGHTMNLDAKFLVTQIGIVIFDGTGITVQPFVSFGIVGNNTFYVANVQTTQLTATDSVQLFTPVNSQLSNSFTISINTLATATTMLGQVFFKGFYCPSWF